jgi:hypothetical protein
LQEGDLEANGVGDFRLTISGRRRSAYPLDGFGYLEQRRCEISADSVESISYVAA